MNEASRRFFLKSLGLAAASASIATIPPNKLEEIKVEKKADWQEVPTFTNGMVLSAEDLQALALGILQLQNEIHKLRLDLAKVGRRAV